MREPSRRFRPFGLVVVAGLIYALTAPASALAQAGTGTVRGVIRDETLNRTLDLVQVSVTGTRLGTRTREDGIFVINGVPAGTQRIQFARVGYGSVTRTVDVTAGETVVLEVAMKETPLSLEELVVTGTAVESRKRELGNSMAAISSQELEVAPVFNAQDVLSARATGVTVLANSGQPGAGGTIRLRGNNSISQGNNPVVYVDGVRIYSENGPVSLQSRQGVWTVNDLPADAIERVEIVRGAAATTLYGTEASGGVIQIFTKKGSTGAPQWDVEIGMGYNDKNLPHFGPDSDPTGLWLKQCSGDLLVDSQGNPFVDPTCPESGSWLKNGFAQRYNASVRGGAGNLTYAISGNYAGEEGVINTGKSQSGGILANFGFAPTDKISFQWSSTYNKSYLRWVPDGNNAGGFLLNVNRGPFNNYKGGKGECDGITITCVTNGYVLDELNDNKRDHFITGLTMNWNTTKSITNRVAVGYDYVYSDDQNTRPFGNLRTPLGFMWKVDWKHTKLTLDYAGSWRAGFSNDKIVSTFSWGAQYFRDQDLYTRVDGDDFSGPGEVTIASAARNTVQAGDRLTVTTAGFFLQEMLGFSDRFFLTLGGRVDGNSSFGEDFGLQFYPKVSAAYVLSDASWWPKSIETFKLRMAAGESGKAPGAFDALRTWTPVAGDEGKPAFTPSQLGNPTLGPERTREIEAGFDLSALDGRLGFEATGYIARTQDALIAVNYPPTEGFLNAQLENVGTIENKGLELTVNGNIIRSQTVDWNVRVNLSLLKSEAIDVGDVPIDVANGALVRNGYPVPGYWGPRVVNANEFANPIVSDTAEFLGRVYPNQIWGFQTTLTLFNRLTVDALGELQSGAYLANWIGYQGARRGAWQPCYDVEAKLRAAAGGDANALNDVTALWRAKCALNRSSQNDRFWIEPSDFFKLRNVSLTYDVPTRLLGGFLRARKLAVTAAVRNALTITDYSGSDPEVKDSRDSGPTALGRRDYYNLPPIRTWFFSVRMGF